MKLISPTNKLYKLLLIGLNHLWFLIFGINMSNPFLSLLPWPNSFCDHPCVPILSFVVLLNPKLSACQPPSVRVSLLPIRILHLYSIYNPSQNSRRISSYKNLQVYAPNVSRFLAFRINRFCFLPR